MFHPVLPAALLRRLLPLGFAVLLCACTPQVELLSQTAEAQANEVLGALLQHGIAAEKVAGKEGKVSVRVPEDRVAQSMAVLQAEGLPREAHASMGDVFKKEGLISSPLEERARMVFALSQELSATISKIDGVIDAEVHVVLPERGGFGEAGNPSSAAVFIKYQDTASIESVVPQIRRLVANSISGLAYDNVSVVLVPSAAPAPTAPPATPRTQSVLGIEVAAHSAALLQAAIVVLALALFGAVAAAAFLFLRGRPAPARADA